jgi:hypothetical protein
MITTVNEIKNTVPIYIRSGNAAWHQKTLWTATSNTAHFMTATIRVHLLVITPGHLIMLILKMAGLKRAHEIPSGSLSAITQQLHHGLCLVSFFVHSHSYFLEEHFVVVKSNVG